MRRHPQKVPRKHERAFTLLEVVLSIGIAALLAAAVYAVSGSAIGASRTAMEQQLALRRLDAFLSVTRNAFLNLPSGGSVTLEVAKGKSGEPEQRLVLAKPQGIFGIPSLAGGSLVLAARPRSDGTRTITLLRIPPNAEEREREEALAAPGIPLLPRVSRPRWTFFQNGNWSEELPAGSPRPQLVRLQMETGEIPDGVEAIFYLPPVGNPQATPTPTPNSPTNSTP